MTNPYNFVQFAPIQRENFIDPAPQNAIDTTLSSGVLTCRIIALSPIFIPFYVDENKEIYEALSLPPKPPRRGETRPIKRNDPHKIFKQFYSGANDIPVIPGSSLKGGFRSVAEALCNGCASVFNGVYSGKAKNSTVNISLPQDLEPCKDRHALCPTCRLFGMSTPSEEVTDKLYFKGKVVFNDARLIGEPKYYGATPQNPRPLVLVTELSSPKPYHYRWYREYGRNDGVAVGRKFYYHRDDLDIVQDASNDADVRDKLLRNQLNLNTPSNDTLHRKTTITPLDRGACFEFQVNYTNLSKEELALLVLTIELFPYRPSDNTNWPISFDLKQFRRGKYHKIGYGKPAGLGTCAVYIINNKLLDYKNRYSGVPNIDVNQELKDEALIDWIYEKKARILNPDGLPADQITRNLPGNIRQLLKITTWPNRENIAYPQYNSPEFNNPLPLL